MNDLLEPFPAIRAKAGLVGGRGKMAAWDSGSVFRVDGGMQAALQQHSSALCRRMCARIHACALEADPAITITPPMWGYCAPPFYGSNKTKQ